MPQTMTLDEKLTISMKACALYQAGDVEGFSRVIRTAPMPPYLAKIYKEKVGVEPLLQNANRTIRKERNFKLPALLCWA